MLTLADGLTLGATDDGPPLCRFRTSGDGGFVVETLADDASVFVNGLPVATQTPVQIEPRDELRIGESLFVVRAAEAAPAPGLIPCPVEMRMPSPPRSLFQLGFDEALLAGEVPASHARRPGSRDVAAGGRCAQLDSRAGRVRCGDRRPRPGCGSGVPGRAVGRERRTAGRSLRMERAGRGCRAAVRR